MPSPSPSIFTLGQLDKKYLLLRMTSFESNIFGCRAGRTSVVGWEELSLALLLAVQGLQRGELAALESLGVLSLEPIAFVVRH